mgnify:CR=1 FL=1|jgi:hypothetical protein
MNSTLLKLAVIGSRSFDNIDLIKEILNEFIYSAQIVISGGAQGTDNLAHDWANENNIPVKLYLPDWKKFGKAAGIIRNKQIVEDADFCIIFWDGKSKGTKNTIDLCNKLHKKYRLITFEN